jgi:hypothetical protein
MKTKEAASYAIFAFIMLLFWSADKEAEAADIGVSIGLGLTTFNSTLLQMGRLSLATNTL